MLLIGGLLILVGACGTSVAKNGSHSNSDGGNQGSTMEVKKDDFIYRLVSEKDHYKVGEKIKLYAELEYMGEEASIKIFHAASPFYFEMEETTRGYSIPYPMEEPLIMTELNKGQPHKQSYIKSGGYSDQDPKDYIQFMKDLLGKDGFPKGNYVVNGMADFYIEKDGEPVPYKMEAEISFDVGE